MAKAKIRLISQLTEAEWQRAKMKRAEDEARWERFLAKREQEYLENKRKTKEIKKWRDQQRKQAHAERLLKEEEEQQRKTLGELREQLREKRRNRGPSATSKAMREKRAGRPMPDVCELCGKSGSSLVFDHCHQKGHFRGWICVTCNLALGMARDSVVLLQKMVDYLERDRLGRETD